MVEAEILSFISNQGLAVGVSVFLIWWVTGEVSKSLEGIAKFLNDHDRKADAACEKINAIYEKVVKNGD
ncbi:hypothetical protein M0R72_12230 [Candidatus Pacearchaeota archaeon]|jgi:hypothetical protein|nr:hypothetical protein [Candidatus Pacearchaeota archaeon]